VFRESVKAVKDSNQFRMDADEAALLVAGRLQKLPDRSEQVFRVSREESEQGGHLNERIELYAEAFAERLLIGRCDGKPSLLKRRANGFADGFYAATLQLQYQDIDQSDDGSEADEPASENGSASTESDPTSDDFDPDVAEPREEFTAQVTDVNSASGLIPRCPVEDCSYVLDSNRCREHGPQDDVAYDLRVKLQVGTGADTYEFIVGREETAALTGINLEQAKAMATDAADYTVVEDTMAQALHGKTVTGEVLAWGDTYVIEEIAVLESAPDPEGVLQDVREMGSLA
jgi:hypothetical protein